MEFSMSIETVGMATEMVVVVVLEVRSMAGRAALKAVQKVGPFNPMPSTPN